MVAPLRLQDPSIQGAYVALSGRKPLDARSADALVEAARGDDGRIDAGERADLQSALRANGDAFTPDARARLEAAIGSASEGAGRARAFDAQSPRPETAPYGRASAAGNGGSSPGATLDGARISAETLRARLQPAWVRPTPADNTQVAIGERRAAPKPESAPGPAGALSRSPLFSEEANRALANAPREELRAAAPGDLERARRHTARMQAAQRAQESTNAIANLDPFAAQVNGMWRGPDGDWTKIGPGPLEATAQYAFAGTVAGRLLGAAGAAKSVATAVTDPTAGNIATAAVTVGLTGGGEWAKAVHSPVKPLFTATKAAKNSTVERERTR
jgi:hypothetical protein